MVYFPFISLDRPTDNLEISLEIQVSDVHFVHDTFEKNGKIFMRHVK
jgi:hypothetical protein